MGGALCCAGEMLCCAGCQAVSCCGKMFQCSGAIGYPIVVMAATVISLVFRFALIDDVDDIFRHFSGFDVCSNIADANAKNTCYGTQFVYRVGFTLVLFFSMMMCLVMCCRKAAHNGGWLWKVTLILGILIASFFIKGDSMLTFGKVCLGGSAIFIVVQILCLLEWVYAWNESWRDKASSQNIEEEDDTSYLWYLLLASIAGYAVAITFIVLSIVWFAHEGCSLAAGEISITVIVCFLFSILSISGINDNGSLLCSSMVSAYCSYYCWSALSGQSNENCNSLAHNDGNSGTSVNVLIGLILTVLSVAYSAYSAADDAGGTLSLHNSHHTAHRDDEECPREPHDEETGRLHVSDAGGRSSYNRMSDKDDKDRDSKEVDWGDYTHIKPLVLYHLVMLLSTMYMTMTIVNWQVDGYDKATTMKDFGTGTEIVWVKIGSQWLTMLLYVWTIMAPVCFPDRQFNFS